MKAIQTANNQGGKLSLSAKFSLKNNHYIKLTSSINKTGLLSAFTFLLLALTCLFPISKSEQTTEAVTGTVQSSSLTLNVSQSAASVELDVNSNTGTFASSTTDNSANFSVTTNNFSGYTLTISGNDDEGKLYDSTKQNFLNSLANATSETDFSSTANTNLNGQWGYKPSKFNSALNENYLPAPTTEASTLDKTAAANTTANDYSISLGLRADYTTTADTYSNSFIITAVPNPIAYIITYDANTTDTVSNMPAAQNSTTSATSITLADKTPVRDNYDFKGWCTVAPTTANPDTCTGTTFQPGDIYGIDQTSENITVLYAIWKQSGIAITYDANGGYFGNNTSKTTNVVIYENTKVTKVSKSPNVDDDGISTGNYDNNLAVADTVTIPGATELHVTITYQTESTSYDWVAIYDGSVTPSAGNYSSSITGKLGGETKVENQEFTIPGDTAQFFFRTDGSSNSYYGYYATIEGDSADILSGEELTPTRDGYAFSGWYTDTAGTAGNEFKITAGMTPQTVYAKWIKYQTITFISGTGGTVNKTTQAVLPGIAIAVRSNKITVDSVTTTATANSGYSFNSWTNNCGATMPESDCTITANFSKNYTITFTSNTGGTVNRTTQSVPYGTAITVSGNSVKTNGVTTTATASSGYKFKSWTNGCGSTMPANDCIITATWNKVELMQTYTASQCQANASSRAVTLEDSRDGKSYRIRYINGLCTMIDNLDFQITTGMTLTTANTNITANRTLGTVGSLTSGNSYDEMRILHSSTSGYGTYYNYAAATLGTITGSSNSTEATQDICPKGWRLPAGGNTSTGYEQKLLTNNVFQTWQSIGTFDDSFKVAAGYYGNGSLGSSGTYGLWWSSTAYDTTYRYYLLYDTSNGLVSGINDYRSRGFSVRCVLK